MRRRARVHIKLESGKWYAFGSGERRARNLLLVPAINFCKRINNKKGGAA